MAIVKRIQLAIIYNDQIINVADLTDEDEREEFLAWPTARPAIIYKIRQAVAQGHARWARKRGAK